MTGDSFLGVHRSFQHTAARVLGLTKTPEVLGFERRNIRMPARSSQSQELRGFITQRLDSRGNSGIVGRIEACTVAVHDD